MWTGPRIAIAALAVLAGLAAALPAAAAATRVGFTAATLEPSACFPPQGEVYGSTSCQAFYGTRLMAIGVATAEDEAPILSPQSFSLLVRNPGGGSTVVAAFSIFDGNEADDTPMFTALRSAEYRLRFEGNAELPGATSAPLFVRVGAELHVPSSPSSGPGRDVGIPTAVIVPTRSLRGTLELRRCRRTGAQSAQSCARSSTYTVLERRSVATTTRFVFPIAIPPGSRGRYEAVFRPHSKGYATTRRGFVLSHPAGGRIHYRPTLRATPFGDR